MLYQTTSLQHNCLAHHVFPSSQRRSSAIHRPSWIASSTKSRNSKNGMWCEEPVRGRPAGGSVKHVPSYLSVAQSCEFATVRLHKIHRDTHMKLQEGICEVQTCTACSSVSRRPVLQCTHSACSRPNPCARDTDTQKDLSRSIE